MQSVPDLEKVMDALKAQLQSMTTGPSPLVKTVTRTWQPWNQLSELAQPAIVIVEPEEDEEHRRGQTSKITMKVQLIVYAQVEDQKDEDSPPIKKLNVIIKGIRTALLPQGSDRAQNENTLGGLVSSCFITGKVKKDAGVLDNQMSALVPIQITVP